MTYHPHPFTWCPGSGARHAANHIAPQHGGQFEALCGQLLTADRRAEAWFWSTCPPCDARAHELAGVPMPPKKAATSRDRSGTPT